MFTRHRRPLLLALLALAIPLPALALSSGSDDSGAPPAPVALNVSTALDSCGIAESHIVCKLDVAFDAIPGATSYTASVTRADGSVVDYGEVGAGGGSLWVPYTGSGHYSVRISAYGTPPEAESGDRGDRGNELITSEATEATEVDPDRTGNAHGGENPGAPAAESDERSSEPNAGHSDAPGADPGPSAPTQSSCDPAPAPVPAEPQEEPLPEPPPTDMDPENPDEDSDGIEDAEERRAYEAALTQRTFEALAAEAELPDSVDCGSPR